ncbi:hypothetical protein L3V77_24960 [Vibrio sp. DW001]|uniref:hypothetical protein n=1 Tax=Vibrio sp. DW001 TaxID=2912315 RepID=UPI0023B0FCFB|nr:hypothetical protein [Vibrio sp. DW001]WED29182.1 hypothetical protein L3V77_24960 [Vibrio sp. DW001]
MTVFDLMVVLIAGLITAFPLCRVAKKLGFKADWWIMLVLVLIPFTQLIYLYFIALKNSES